MPDDDNTPDMGNTPDPTAALQAEVDKWKKLARQHETQSKANYAELQKLQAAGDSSQSDMDRLTATIEKLQSDLAESERGRVVTEIAAERGLTKAQAGRLRGKTRDELEADADDMVEAFGIKKPGKGDDTDPDGDKAGEDDKNGQEASGGGTPPAGGRPKENLRPGAAGESEADEVDPVKIADAVLKSAF